MPRPQCSQYAQCHQCMLIASQADSLKSRTTCIKKAFQNNYLRLLLRVRLRSFGLRRLPPRLAAAVTCSSSCTDKSCFWCSGLDKNILIPHSSWIVCANAGSCSDYMLTQGSDVQHTNKQPQQLLAAFQCRISIQQFATAVEIQQDECNQDKASLASFSCCTMMMPAGVIIWISKTSQ